MFEPDQKADSGLRLVVDTRDVIGVETMKLKHDEAHTEIRVKLRKGFESRLAKMDDDTDDDDDDNSDHKRNERGGGSGEFVTDSRNHLKAADPGRRASDTDDIEDSKQQQQHLGPSSPATIAKEMGMVVLTGNTNAIENLGQHLRSLVKWYHKDKSIEGGNERDSKMDDSKLTLVELREMLRALGMFVQNETHLRSRLKELQVMADSGLDLEKITKVMAGTDTFNRVQEGRYFVATSLREAEALRGCIHLRQGRPLVDGKNAEIALRVGDTMIDSSGGFQEAGQYQGRQARQLFKFFNSDLDFAESEVSMLLAGIKKNDLEARTTWFEDIRSVRRRSRKDWKSSSISPVFCTANEYILLARRAVLATVRLLIKVNGMRLLDAFRAFDSNHDGILLCSELYGGLEWLGMSLQPKDIHEIVRYIDKTGEGRVTWEDFEKALSNPELDDLEDDEEDWEMKGGSGGVAGNNNNNANNRGSIILNNSFMRVHIKPKPMEELWEDPRLKGIKVVEDIPMQVLKEIKIKPKSVPNWQSKPLWDSRHSNARTKVSVWEPQVERKFTLNRNKMRFCLGFYATTSYNKPNKSKCQLIELTDEGVTRVLKSSNLDDAHLNHLVPHPIRYKQVWSQVDKGSSLYAWKPIPPNKNYVALGMVATTSNNEPPLQAMRCVPIGWTVISKTPPKKIWTDAGTGGRKGSMWVVNSFGTVVFADGHNAPPGPFYELKARRFHADEGYVKGAHSLKPDLESQLA